MPAWLAPVLGAASSIGGGLLGMFGQSSANKQNRRLVQEQMKFQERMSSTAYQRAMADMKKAGLNPMLAYSQGGASTPSGATATMQNELSPLAAGVSSAGQQALALQGQATQNKILKQNLLVAEASGAKAQLQKRLYDSLDLPAADFEKLFKDGYTTLKGDLLEALENATGWNFTGSDTSSAKEQSGTQTSSNTPLTVGPGSTLKSDQQTLEAQAKKKLAKKLRDVNSAVTQRDNIRKQHRDTGSDDTSLFREYQLALSKGLKMSFRDFKKQRELLRHRRNVQNYQRRR